MSEQRTSVFHVTLSGQEWERDIHDMEQGVLAKGKPFRRHLIAIEPYTEDLAVYGKIAEDRAIQEAHRNPPGPGRYHYVHISSVPIQTAMAIQLYTPETP